MACISSLIFFNFAPNQDAIAAGPNRYWVGQSGVISRFCTSDALNSWSLADNNGTGSFALNDSGSARLRVDDLSGGYELNIENIKNNIPNLISLDKSTGKVELKIQDLSAGQVIQLRAREFNNGGNLVSTTNIGFPIVTAGSYIFNLNTVQFSSAMTQVQFVINTVNTNNIQGYVDLRTFNYTSSSILWSNPSNWSLSSNGTGGAGVPAASGLAIFGTGSGDCYLDTAINVLGIDMLTTFTGSIRQGDQPLSVNASHFDVLGGTFIGGDTDIELNTGSLRYTGGTFVSTSGNIITRKDLTLTGPSFYHNKGKILVNDNSVTITSSVSLYDLTFVSNSNTKSISVPVATGLNLEHDFSLEGAGRIDLNSGGKIYIQGDLHLLNTFKGGQGTADIVFNGTGVQRINGTQMPGYNRLPDDIIIDKPSGTLFINGTISPTRNLNLISGNVDASAATLYLSSSSATISGNWTFKEIIFDSNGATPAANNTYTVSDNSKITVTDKINITGLSNSILNKAGSGKIVLLGDLELTSTGTLGAGSCVISFEGTKDQKLMSQAIANSCRVPHLSINKTGGILTYSGIISSAGDFEYLQGNVDPGTSTFLFTTSNNVKGKAAFYDLIYSKITTGTNTHTLNDTVSVSNNFEQNGIGTITINGGQLDVMKNVTIANTPIGGNSSVIINLIGNTDQILSGTPTSGQGRIGGLIINKNSGTLYLENFITMTRDLTYIKGIVNAGQSTILMGSNVSNLQSQNGGNTMTLNNLSLYSSVTYLKSDLKLLSSLEILPGASLDATLSNYNIELQGDWKNAGTFTRRDGTVTFNGSTKQNITVTLKENFNNLNLSNTALIADAVQLNGNVQVYKQLLLNTSKVFLNNFNLTVGSGRASTTIGNLKVQKGWLHGGSVTRWLLNTKIADNDTAGFFPVGSAWDSRGVYISNPVTVSNGGSITLTHTPSAQVIPVSVPDGTATIVNRLNANWLITNTLITSGIFNLRIGGTGFGTIGNVNDLRIMAANSVIGNSGLNSGSILLPWVERTGLTPITLVNQFYIGSINRVQSPLPVTLLNYTAKNTDNGVLNSWTTGSELNNDYFNIQHSIDGIDYKTIGKIAGSGTVNQTRNYEYVHRDPAAGNNYYRLTQTDFDGKFEIFDPIVVQIKLEKELPAFELTKVFPNPFVDQFTIELKCIAEESLTIYLDNSLGNRIMELDKNTHYGYNEILINTNSDLTPGSYILTIMNKEGLKESIRLIKKN